MLLIYSQKQRSLQELVDRSGRASVTYVDVGGSLHGAHPADFRHDHDDRVLGQGEDVFEHAKQGLQSWGAHSSLGVRVFPRDTAVAPGSTVIVLVGAPLSIAAPCRVVEVLDEPRRWGFAYGTLPGHPEQGEESFVVTWADDDLVHFEIQAYSRPANRLVRLSGPIAQWIQRLGTSSYFTAMQKYVIRRYPSQGYP
jgi:uncharacterized protein (UPF0548 family)